MKVEFCFENAQHKVFIDGAWNSLSLFLETDSIFDEIRNHIELKKKRMWMGNTSTIKLVSGSQFEISTDLDLELDSVVIFQKQLLKLMDVWRVFEEDKKPRVINV
jgi:hypothetical protein